MAKLESEMQKCDLKPTTDRRSRSRLTWETQSSEKKRVRPARDFGGTMSTAKKEKENSGTIRSSGEGKRWNRCVMIVEKGGHYFVPNTQGLEERNEFLTLRTQPTVSDERERTETAAATYRPQISSVSRQLARDRRRRNSSQSFASVLPSDVRACAIGRCRHHGDG